MAIVRVPVKLGADPELFIRKDRKKIPAFGLIGGTKKEPLPMNGIMNYTGAAADTPGFMYQEDGAAFEFNIPPAESPQQFLDYIRHSATWIHSFLQKKEFGISLSNHIKLTSSQLKVPGALEIGCVADYCAYLPADQRERTPFTATDLGMNRYAGGHIHVQYNHVTIPKHAFVKLADLAVILAGCMLDKQGQRRKYYGLAGIYRDKKYGVELRSMSNTWAVEIMHEWTSPSYHAVGERRRAYATGIIHKLFALANMSNEAHSIDILGEVYTTTAWDDVQTAINNEDPVLAFEIMKEIRAKHKDFPIYAVNMDGSVYLQ